MASIKHLVDIDLNGNEIQNAVLQNISNPTGGAAGQVVYNTAQGAVYVSNGTSYSRVGLTADGSTITDSNGTISVGTIAISKVSGLQTALDGKVDDSQVLTNVPANAVFTDTTYSIGDGGLTEANFTDLLRDKLNNIEDGATATARPAIESNGSLPILASGITAGEVRTLIGAGTSSFDGTWNSLSGKPSTFTPSAHTHEIAEINGLDTALAGKLDTGALAGYATETYVNTAVANVIDAAPAALDTLNELAAALGDDANFSTTITTALGTKLNASAYTAADVLAKIKTVDGAGSGLDADLLDGQSSAYYRNYNNLTNKPTIPQFISQEVTGTGVLTDLALGLGGYANIQIYEGQNLVMTEIVQDGAGSAQALLENGVVYQVVAVGL